MTSFDNKQSGNEASDPLDLTNLRLSQSFTQTAGVKKLLNTVRVRKPGPEDWVRVHPDPQMRVNSWMYTDKDEREEYLVTGAAISELAGHCSFRTLYTTVNRKGEVSLWPVRLPDPDGGKELDWYRSAREAAELAMTRWVRIKANLGLGAYDIFKTEACIAEPAWPEEDFQQIIRTAFRNHVISSADHLAVKRLHGLV
jgi:hypothetical protein